MFIQPKTDWGQADHVTAEDLNRIFGNINHLTGGSLKDNFTADDFLTLAQWNGLIVVLRNLELATRVVASVPKVKTITIPDTTMTSETFNNAETLIQNLQERVSYMFKQKAAISYAGDPVYASQVPDVITRGL